LLRKALLLGISFLLLSPLASISYAAEPPSSLEISIPDYTVTTVGALDYVDIPSGEILLAEEGRPRVPYYATSINYPKGYQVQDVILEERSGLETEEGLRLSVVVLSSNLTSLPEMEKGWYPEEDYNWRVWENPNGSTTLIIKIYPFYYDPETTDVKFYKNYRFDIEYIISNVEITALSTDKDVYEPGDEVTLDMCLNNSGETQDIVVSSVIRQHGRGEIIEGLPIRSLKDFVGEGSYSAVWSIGDAETGYYYAEAILTDTSGNVLDKDTVGFGIQVSEAGEGPPPAQPGEFPTLYVIIGAVVVVAIIASALVIRSRKKA